MEHPRIQEIPGFYGERLIKGVFIKELTMYADERGTLPEVMRLDDKEMNAKDIKQIIAFYSYPGMVKIVLYDYQKESST